MEWLENWRRSMDGVRNGGFAPPGNGDRYSPTDQPDTFYDKQEGKFVRVDPMSQQQRIMGLLPYLGIMMGDGGSVNNLPIPRDATIRGR